MDANQRDTVPASEVTPIRGQSGSADMGKGTPMLRVHSIETFGTHEGPGIRLVLFLQGCPVRCVYCHNPDTQACRVGDGRVMTSAEVLERLERQRAYFHHGGGLTVSGGEPTLQAEALLELFSEARGRGFHVALDSNGLIATDAVRALYDLTDLVILDVKHIDDGWHRRITGSSNRNPLRNAAYREASGRPLWLRYVLVPGWSDQPEFLEAWARHFAGYRTLERVELLPYHTLGAHKYAALGRPFPLPDVQPPAPDLVARTRELFARHLPNVLVA